MDAGHLLRYSRQMDGFLPTVYEGLRCAQLPTSRRLGALVGRHGPEALDVHTRLVVLLTPMGDSHRVAISADLYQAARQYMVEHGLPHVRAAVEAMIRAESSGEQRHAEQTNQSQEVVNAERGR